MTNKATIFWYLIFIIGFSESFGYNGVNNKFEDAEIRGELKTFFKYIECNKKKLLSKND